MNADISSNRLNEITSAVIGAGHAVSNALGCGFLEKVYENALTVELRWAGHDVAQQHAVDVRYKTTIVGTYMTDLLVDECVIVELKALPMLNRVHHAQCLNYLRATGLRVALLLNFGHPKLEVRRIVSRF